MRQSRSLGGEELTQRDLVRLRKMLLEAEEARVFKRALALLLLAEGRTWAEASRLSTLGRATISFWLGRYLRSRKLSSLHDQPHTGRILARPEFQISTVVVAPDRQCLRGEHHHWRLRGRPSRSVRAGRPRPRRGLTTAAPGLPRRHSCL